ncbi:hypothetical protein NQZ68_015004 [Dissostichus eleginoides]|nr:hypothetical protein NQZ68_015004 [Dissostichus eleginoides]
MKHIGHKEARFHSWMSHSHTDCFLTEHFSDQQRGASSVSPPQMIEALTGVMSVKQSVLKTVKWPSLSEVENLCGFRLDVEVK